jgi:hypothetical protein
MGQPTPPGDNVPLYEGLDSSWNDIVSAFPEDRRNELAPLLKSRIDSYEPLKQWESFQKDGITPDSAKTALDTLKYIESNPKDVYEAIGKHLGISATQAEQVVEEIEDGDSTDPRIAKLQQQIDTMSQIMIAGRQQTLQEKEAAQQDAAIDKEINALKAKHGDEVNEEEVIMRMLHKNMTAEQAHQEYSAMVSELRRTRPAPMLLGSGGSVPKKGIDVTKLDSAGTKNLVAQMLEHANVERKS